MIFGSFFVLSGVHSSFKVFNHVMLFPYHLTKVRFCKSDDVLLTRLSRRVWFARSAISPTRSYKKPESQSSYTRLSSQQSKSHTVATLDPEPRFISSPFASSLTVNPSTCREQKQERRKPSAMQ